MMTPTNYARSSSAVEVEEGSPFGPMGIALEKRGGADVGFTQWPNGI